MVASRMPARLLWAVDVLNIAPDDRLLEIDCGAGLAVSLACERLNTGTITAIDQSEAMIRLAQQRNQAHIAAGKAVFQARALEAAAFGDARFSKVFAFNVNLFERQPASALQVIKTHLLPDGALYLFYQPPLAEKTRRIAERVEHNLQANGFSVREITTNDLRPTPVVCLIANVE